MSRCSVLHEFEIRDRVHKLGAHAIEGTALVERKKGVPKGSSMSCPHCQDDARTCRSSPQIVRQPDGRYSFSACLLPLRAMPAGDSSPGDVTLRIMSPQRLTPGAEEVAAAWRGIQERASARRPSGPCGRWRAFASADQRWSEPPKPPANAWVWRCPQGQVFGEKRPWEMEP